ncbi:MAG: zinc ABC transporter substrate-binding protein [Candidatus Korarchaeum sp.]|nr:zinc ABC transporter substrate-binding protein [Candidatus Korarchaeum sp.]MDW8035189.1 metal ABC transporter substrate-binding protein [Candidatus Korarchaeum sp.]
MRLLPLLLLILLLPTLTVSADGKLKVVCSTTVLCSIVRDLTSDSIEVEVITPPNVCPGHYDVRPSDAYALTEADLVLYHGIEPWVEELGRASGSLAPAVKVSGGWNTPDTLKSLYVNVSKVLDRYLGLNTSTKLERCLKAIDETAEGLRRIAEGRGFSGKPVVSMMFQADFLRSLGFRVVATFPPPERVSAKLFESIVKNATESKAVLVVDNLQSGTEVGFRIASQVDALEVALSNFPESPPELKNMTQVMKWNAERLADALSYAELKASVRKSSSRAQLYETLAIMLAILAIVEAVIILRRK